MITASDYRAARPLLLFAATAWGASFVAARAVLSAPAGLTSLTPLLLATVRFVIACGFFVPLLVVRLRRGERIARADLPQLALLGQLAISLYFFLQYTGVQLTNAGVASVLVVGGIPLATTIVAALLLGEPLGLRRLVALLVGAAGVAIVASQRGLSVEGSGGFIIGAACLAVDAVCFALYSTMTRRLRSRYSATMLTSMTTLWGTAGLLVVSLATDDWSSLGTLTAGQWGAVLYLALACSVLAYLAYNHALAAVPAGRAAAWIYLETPVAIALGALVLGETVTAATVGGGAIILAALYALERR